jgi:hypothetical protein
MTETMGKTHHYGKSSTTIVCQKPVSASQKKTLIMRCTCKTKGYASEASQLPLPYSTTNTRVFEIEQVQAAASLGKGKHAGGARIGLPLSS